MTTRVRKSVLVNVPLSTVYNQWTQFEDFPRFMDGVEQVTQLADDRLEWVVHISGVRRQWVAKILEQVPDRRIAWAAVESATNAGAVDFAEPEAGATEVQLTLDYEPEGFVESVGDRLGMVERRAEADLERFKGFCESHRRIDGAWRGAIHEGATVENPSIEDAASSVGDSGKVGQAAEAEASFQADPAAAGLIGTTAVGELAEPGDRGLNPTDAASGFGDPKREMRPGVVER